MALSLPTPGGHPWAGELNAALTQLDEQTVVDGIVVGDNLILTKNDGTTVDAGDVRGPAGAPGGSDEAFAEFVSDPGTETGQAVIAAQGVTLSVAPEMSTAAVQSVLSSAPTGSRVVFAPGDYPAPTNGFTVTQDGVHIDASRASFTQTVWGRPVFDLIGRSDMTVDIGFAEFTGTRGTHASGGSYRGSASYVSGAAVWINGDRNYVRSLRTKGLVCGVFLSAWDGTSMADKYSEGNRLGRIEVEEYNFGVLWVGQNNLVIEDVYGHDDIDDSSGNNPTHVYYGSSLTTHRDTNVTILSARAERNTHGQAFQAKYTDNLTLGPHSASDCTGVANFIDCHDMSISSMTSIRDLGFTTYGSFTMQSTNQVSQRPRVSNVAIDLASGYNQRAFLIISDDGVYSNLSATTRYTSGVGSGVGAIDLRGQRNRLVHPTVTTSGTASHGVVVGGLPVSVNSRIENPSFTGVTNGVYAIASGASAYVSYQSGAQSLSGTMAGAVAGSTVSAQGNPPVALSTFGQDPTFNLLVAAGSPTVGAANSVLQTKVRPSRDITVTGLRWWSGTPSGNYDIGIIDDATNTRLWSSGSLAWPAAGPVTETVTGVTLRAGLTYRLVFAADNATGTLRGLQSPTAGLDVTLAGLPDSTTVSAAFPLPSSLVAGSTASTRRPLIVVLGT